MRKAKRAVWISVFGIFPWLTQPWRGPRRERYGRGERGGRRQNRGVGAAARCRTFSNSS